MNVNGTSMQNIEHVEHRKTHQTAKTVFFIFDLHYINLDIIFI